MFTNTRHPGRYGRNLKAEKHRFLFSRYLFLPLVFLPFVFSACSTINETTGLDIPEPNLAPTEKAALTGAVVGGGLGLILGSTAGMAGEGVIIGSLAGGGLGAAIGSSSEASDKARARERDSAALSQEKRKQSKLDEEQLDLNKDRADTLSDSDIPLEAELTKPASAQKTKTVAAVAAAPTARASISQNSGYLSAPSGKKSAVKFSEDSNAQTAKVLAAGSAAGATAALVAKSKGEAVNHSAAEATGELKTKPREAEGSAEELEAAVDEELGKNDLAKESDKQKNDTHKNALPLAATATASAVAVHSASTPKAEAVAKLAPGEKSGCKDAISEAERGLNASSDADRLFYFKRAARLCPNEPSYQLELGKLYGSIGKNEEAKTALRKVIEIEPNNQVARDELSILENAAGAK